MRSDDYANGRREAVKWAVSWLHDRAREMNDPAAWRILNSAAYSMGRDAQDAIASGSMDYSRKTNLLKRTGLKSE